MSDPSRNIFRTFIHICQRFSASNARRVFLFLRKHGIRQLILRLGEKIVLFFRPIQTEPVEQAARDPYEVWIERNEPDEVALDKQRTQSFPFQPKFSIVVPCYQTPGSFLEPMIESVLRQSYENWQLCLSIAGETPVETQSLLQKYKQKDSRIVIVYQKEGESTAIADNTNRAIRLADGNYIVFLDHDDTLSPFALFELAKCCNNHPSVDFIYSDEDKISEDGTKRHTPHFKPEWSPDLLRSYNYITHIVAVSSSLMEQLHGIRSGFEGSQDYDFVLRATELAKQIIHIPKILYHWREHQGSTAANINAKDSVTTSTNRALREHLQRIGRATGNVSDGPYFGSAFVNYHLNDQPLVSIIVPNHDQARCLRSCIESILNKSTYTNYEIIIMENNSQEETTHILYKELSQHKKVSIIDWHHPFNYSKINNDAIKHARGSILLFINNDLEVITTDWIEQMLGQLQWEENGAVGAKLCYPDQTIQHAGVIIGIGGIAGHPHKYFASNSPGYFSRLALVQNFSAVTAACIMVKRNVFEEVGGFDEGYPLAFNDVDLCLKIRKAGYLIIWTPAAELLHYESKTRGPENTEGKRQRFRREIEYFQEKWSDILHQGDPYYNPNLTLRSENFAIRTPDEICRT